LAIVLGQGVAGASAEGGSPKGHQGRTTFLVSFVDGYFLDVGRPLRVALDVMGDLEAPVGRRRHRDALRRLLGHRVLLTAVCRSRRGHLNPVGGQPPTWARASASLGARLA